MSEVWERDFDDICADEGEVYSVDMSWKKAFKLVRQKWQPLVPLAAQALDEMKDKLNSDLAAGEVPYILSNALCAFCLKAAALAGTSDYGRAGAACMLCCLQGRCFDDAWRIKDIFVALRAEQYDEFRELIIEGLQEVNEAANEF